MRVGIAGFGKMGMLHGALLNSLPDVEIVAITDTSKLILKAFQSVMPGASYFTSYEKMIDSCRLDAIAITTPSFSHVQIAKYAANKGIHIFLEKPISNSLDKAVELYNLIKDKNVISMVGFHMRYMPAIMKGKEILDLKLLGNIKNIESEIYVSDVFSEQTGWRYNPDISGGGVLIDFTIHLLDLLYWLFGEVKQVKGKMRSVYSKSVEDEVEIEIGFKNNLSARVNSSWSIPNYRLPYIRINITGENGDMVITDHYTTVTMIDKNNNKNTVKYSISDLYSGYYIDIAGPHYSLQMKAFADKIKNNERTNSFEQALYVQRLVDSIYKSCIQNKTIEL